MEWPCCLFFMLWQYPWFDFRGRLFGQLGLNLTRIFLRLIIIQCNHYSLVHSIDHHTVQTSGYLSFHTQLFRDFSDYLVIHIIYCIRHNELYIFSVPTTRAYTYFFILKKCYLERYLSFKNLNIPNRNHLKYHLQMI